MEQNVDERLAALEQELHAAKAATAGKPKRRRWVTLSVALIVLAAAGAAGAVYVSHSRTQSLPSNVVKSAQFPLYFPAPLPDGSTFKDGSARQEAGIIFYSIETSRGAVSVSEQPIPDRPPSLSSLIGFKKFDTPYGTAVTGKNGNAPVALISTDTTLITLTGTNAAATDTVISLARAMMPLESK
jgi:hypothetical protein